MACEYFQAFSGKFIICIKNENILSFNVNSCNHFYVAIINLLVTNMCMVYFNWNAFLVCDIVKVCVDTDCTSHVLNFSEKAFVIVSWSI